jgi:oligopeptide transport system permease protein
MWVRVWWGARISLFVGITAALIDLAIGVIYGGISAYYGGKVDDIMQRFIEIIYSIPYLLIAILLIMVIGPGLWTIILAYTLIGWVPMARLVRGQVLQLKEQEYVLAARTLGASSARIIFRHLVPNALGLIIVQLTFAIPGAIFFESFLSFLGLGIKVPLASLGSLLSDGVQAIRLYPHRVMIPTIVFSLILLSFNLLGDGLRDALDPKMRK